MKVAYNILHKLGTKQEPMVRPGDRVSSPKTRTFLFLYTHLFINFHKLSGIRMIIFGNWQRSTSIVSLPFWPLNINDNMSFSAARLILKACSCQISMCSGIKADILHLLSFYEQVALVFPNNDPAAFMVAFYGCLLAEVVPVPIEVPLTRKVRIQIYHDDMIDDRPELLELERLDF